MGGSRCTDRRPGHCALRHRRTNERKRHGEGKRHRQLFHRQRITALFACRRSIGVVRFLARPGQPIADIAAKYGAGNFQGNVIYIFSNGGAFLSTAIYCLYLHNKHKTIGEYVKLSAAGSGSLAFHFALAFVTGILWYAQFFFYGLGHTRMGAYKFSSWAIHMILLVLFSATVGLILREWAGGSAKTKTTLALALVVLIAAVLLLTYGNSLGGTV